MCLAEAMVHGPLGDSELGGIAGMPSGVLHDVVQGHYKENVNITTNI